MSFATGFGHGAPSESYLYPPMTLEQIEALAAWFLACRPTVTEENSAPGILDSDDPTTGGINRTIKRLPSGNPPGAGSGNTQLIFRTVRASRSTSEHVALPCEPARNPGRGAVCPGCVLQQRHDRQWSRCATTGRSIGCPVTSVDSVRIGVKHGQVSAAAALLKRICSAG